LSIRTIVGERAISAKITRLPGSLVTLAPGPPNVSTKGSEVVSVRQTRPEPCGSHLRSRRHEVETSGTRFNQNSVPPGGPHDLAGAPGFRHQFLHCIRSERLRSQHSFVIFRLRRGSRYGEHASGVFSFFASRRPMCGPSCGWPGRVILNGSMISFSSDLKKLGRCS